MGKVLECITECREMSFQSLGKIMLLFTLNFPVKFGIIRVVLICHRSFQNG